MYLCARYSRERDMKRYQESERRRASVRAQDRARQERGQFMEYWHRANGGWFVRRKRELASQREAVVRQLADLKEKEKTLVDQQR